MSELALPSMRIPAMSPQALGRVRAFEAAMMELPQEELATSHLIHGGMYARSITLPVGVVLTGAEIKLATVLIISGHVTVHLGDDSVELTGYHVLPASKGRKQAFVAHADTHMTMLFPSEAQSTEQAEQQFTDESERLMSRHGINHIHITGE